MIQMSKFPIVLKDDIMTVWHCPSYGDFDHYVFMCLSYCNDFKGIADGSVICNYQKERL